MRNVMKSIFPAPLLSIALLVLWLLLNRSVSAGQILLGLILGLLIPDAAARPAPAGAGQPSAEHSQAGLSGGLRHLDLQLQRGALSVVAAHAQAPGGLCPDSAGPARPQRAGGAGHDRLSDAGYVLGRDFA